MKRLAVIHASAVVALLLTLAACQPAKPSAEDAAAAELRAAGYNRAPEVTGVVQKENTVFISGKATDSDRVVLTYSATDAAGRYVRSTHAGEAGKDGRFVVEVPIGPFGGVYDLQASDSGRTSDTPVRLPVTVAGDPGDESTIRGRTLHAEGRLFVPRDQPDRAVMLRPGGAGRSLAPEKQIIAVADYDSTGGIAVSGHVAPDVTVNLVIGGTVIGRSQSDADGRYQVTGQIAAPTPTETGLAIEVATEKQSQTRTIPVSQPALGDRITPIEGGWRVDWVLPGGGMQTSVVY